MFFSGHLFLYLCNLFFDQILKVLLVSVARWVLLLTSARNRIVVMVLKPIIVLFVGDNLVDRVICSSDRGQVPFNLIKLHLFHQVANAQEEETGAKDSNTGVERDLLELGILLRLGHHTGMLNEEQRLHLIAAIPSA